MTSKQQEELKEELQQFVGTSTYFCDHIKYPDFSWTDGVQYFCQTTNMFYLIGIIFQLQVTAIVGEFQVWKVTKRDSGFSIEVTDGNKNIINTVKMDNVPMPVDEITLWFVKNVLLLPSEY